MPDGKASRCDESDATTLRGASAVVCLRGNVLDRADLEASGLEGTDRGFTAGAGPLNEDVDLLHAVFLGATRGRLCCKLRSEGGGLTRTLEADLTRRGPGDNGTSGVGQGNDGVVKRRLDVRVTVGDVLVELAARLTSSTGARSFCSCQCV